MAGLITGFPPDGVVTVNRGILNDGHTVDDLQERVALLCENVKTYHSDTGCVGGFVALNSGDVSNEGPTIGQAVQSPLASREALIITFWRSFADHERSHRSATFQPLFRDVLEQCENGNEEIACRRSGPARPTARKRPKRPAWPRKDTQPDAP